MLEVNWDISMVKNRVKEARNLAILLGLVLFWTVFSRADEWDRMQIHQFEPRRDAPKVSLKSLDGNKVSLEDYKGKVVFLNFWTTWCGYCKREMPSMEKLYAKFKDKDFVILAVDVRESKEKVKTFWDRYKLTFPAVLDPTGMAAMAFGVRGYPATFFIDRKGRVVGGAPGAREWFSEDAQAIIAELVEEGGTPGEEKGARVETDPTGTDEEEQKSKTESGPEPFDISSIAGPSIRSQGQTKVKSTEGFDLDEGKVGDDRRADFSWSEVGFSTRYLIPQNGAEFVNKGIVDQVTFDDIILSKYSGSPINASGGEENKLKPGTILYVRTSEGRYACFRVDGYGRNLDISWVTYEKN
jgi:thiol-disulfide isomerase/thioredoxin